MAWNYRNLWFWRLDVWNQGVDRAMLPQKALGENSFLPLSSFWWLSAIFGIPWFTDASIQFLPQSSHHLVPFCLALSFLPFLQWHWSYWIPSPFCSNRRWNPNVMKTQFITSSRALFPNKVGFLGSGKDMNLRKTSSNSVHPVLLVVLFCRT